MESFEKLINNIWIQRIIWSIIVILVSLLFYTLFSRFVSNREKKDAKLFGNKKNRTLLKMLRSVVRYCLIVLAALFILQIFGVNVSSMLAGVGIVGITIGFAIQDALKDIIRGLDIVSDNYYSVGDVVKYGDIVGKVLLVGIKTTKIQDLSSMNTVSIANRNIDQVELVSNAIYIDIPLPYELKIAKAETVINQMLSDIKKLPDVTNASYLGLNNFNSSSLDYLIEIDCDPALKRPVRRAALGLIVKTMESHGITVPYQQIDLHNKK